MAIYTQIRSTLVSSGSSYLVNNRSERLKQLYIAALLGVGLLAVSALKAGTYSPTWASVDQHNPAPEWYQDAKFGIYWHWGPYCVAEFDREWYPHDMYQVGSSAYNHHKSVYGDPVSVFGYQDFIKGKNDLTGHFTQFAPKLKSAGGNWDPNEWAQLFSDAGAKFASCMAEFHDGYSMWNSTVNEWNSVKYGPHLDIVALMSNAIRAKGMKFQANLHTAENFNGFYQFVPPQSDPSLKKLFGQLGSTAEDQLWYDKMKEVIDNFHPDIIYNDFALNKISESQRLNFLAYYYNDAVAQGKEVVTTFKSYDTGSFDTKGEVVCFERGGPAEMVTPYWLTAEAPSVVSWSYIQGMQYYSSTALLHSFMDRISKNGNMQLDVAPMPDGTIPQEQKDILLALGGWLKRDGEGVYATRAWLDGAYGEGPTRMGKDGSGHSGFTTPTVATNKDIRFTCNKAKTVLYATVLGWPGNAAQLNITTLSNARINLGSLTNVLLLGATPGTYVPVSYAQDASGLKVTMPGTQPYTADAYMLKLTFSGQIPPLNPLYEAETLALSSNVQTVVDSDPRFSGGQSVKLEGVAVGDYVEFTIPNAPTGNYSVTLTYRAINTRGQVQLTTDGIAKNTVDQYSATDSFGKTVNLGSHNFKGGNSLLRFTITGKNSASTGYTASIDSILLTPIP